VNLDSYTSRTKSSDGSALEVATDPSPGIAIVFMLAALEEEMKA